MKKMKRMYLYVCASVCTLSLMTSCHHEVTPDTISGVYQGSMDVKFNLIGLDEYDIELPNRAVVTKINESYVDISIELNLSDAVHPSLAEALDEDLDFGIIYARCLVGPTVDGEASLDGTAMVGGKAAPVVGEYEDKVLELTIVLSMLSVEFEGVRR